MRRNNTDKVLIGHAEKRTSPRLPPEAFPTLNGAYIRGGASVSLIDISSGGALVESEERLAPNTKTFIKIATTEGTFVLKGRVIRSTISQLRGIPRYRSGIAFDDKNPLQAVDLSPATAEDIEAAAEQSSATPTTPPLQVDSETPQKPHPRVANPETEETLTLITSIPQLPPSLKNCFELIKINNW
jgi:hypothetical protein